MIVEMRIYHCAPGRLPALNDRFSNITLDFFKKYGIEPIGFWTTLAGPSNHALTYLLKWESLAERETKWNAFRPTPSGSRNAPKPRRSSLSSSGSKIIFCRRRLIPPCVDGLMQL